MSGCTTNEPCNINSYILGDETTAIVLTHN